MTGIKLISFIFIVFLCVQSKYNFPNIIWLYWQQGHNNLDQLGKACESRIQQMNKKNWEVKYVSDQNLQQYFDQNQIMQLNTISKYQAIKQSSLSRSFFVRLMLLKKYGGVYLDTYVILLQNLDWLNDLENNNQVMNKLEDKSPQAFLFYEAQDPQLGRLNIIKEDQITFYPTFEIEFMLIAAMKGSIYINNLLNQLKVIHQQGQFYYNNLKESFMLFRQLNPYQTLPLANHIIQHTQFRDYELRKQRGQLVPLDHFYHVWSINRMKGPFTYFNEKNIQIMFKDVNHFTYQPKYLIKLTLYERGQRFGNFLKNDSYHKDMLLRQNNPFLFDLGSNYLPESLSCLYKSYIDQNSIAALLVKTNYSSENSQIKSLKISQNNQTPWICKKTTIYNLYDHFQNIWEFLYIPFYLIVGIQLLIEIFLGLKRYNIQLREQNLSENNKEYLKEKLYFIGMLGYALILQCSFMYEEVFMWYYQSPYSFYIWMIQLTVIFFVLSYFRIVKIKPFGLIINLEIFVVFVVFLLFLQQFIFQYFSIWNYDGFLFHFEKLSRMNRETNNEFFWGFLQILVMFVIAKIYFSIKKSYNKNREQIYQKISTIVYPATRYLKNRYNQLFTKNENKTKVQKYNAQESLASSSNLKIVEETPQISQTSSKFQQ